MDFNTYQNYPLYEDTNGYQPVQDVVSYHPSNNCMPKDFYAQIPQQQHYTTGNNFVETYTGNPYYDCPVESQPQHQQTQMYQIEQQMAPVDCNNQWVAHGNVVLNSMAPHQQFYQGHSSVQGLIITPQQQQARSCQPRSRKRCVQADVQGFYYQSSGQLPTMEAAYRSYPIAHLQQQMRPHQQMHSQQHHRMGSMLPPIQMLPKQHISQFSPQNLQQMVPQMSPELLNQQQHQSPRWPGQHINAPRLTNAQKYPSLVEQLKSIHQKTDKTVATSANVSGTSSARQTSLTEEEKRNSALWRILHEVDSVEELIFTMNSNRPLIPIDAQDVIEFETSDDTNIPMPTDHLILKFKESPNVFACS